MSEQDILENELGKLFDHHGESEEAQAIIRAIYRAAAPYPSCTVIAQAARRLSFCMECGDILDLEALANDISTCMRCL